MFGMFLHVKQGGGGRRAGACSVGPLSLDKLISNHVVSGDKLANRGEEEGESQIK